MLNWKSFRMNSTNNGIKTFSFIDELRRSIGWATVDGTSLMFQNFLLRSLLRVFLQNDVFCFLRSFYGNKASDDVQTWQIHFLISISTSPHLFVLLLWSIWRRYAYSVRSTSHKARKEWIKLSLERRFVSHRIYQRFFYVRKCTRGTKCSCFPFNQILFNETNEQSANESSNTNENECLISNFIRPNWEWIKDEILSSVRRCRIAVDGFATKATRFRIIFITYSVIEFDSGKICGHFNWIRDEF